MSEQTKSSQQDTYSVKTTSAVKDELTELLRLTGLPSKELFEAMVTNYKIMALQGTEVERTEDVQQVRYHLSKAETLFMNLVQKNQDIKNDYTDRISQENMLHKQITDELQQLKVQAIQERDAARNEQRETAEELKKAHETIVELADRGRSDRLTIDVLTRKTEELEIQVTAMPKLMEQQEQLQQEKISLQHQVDGLQTELNKYKELLDSTQARISDISQEKERTIKQALEAHKKDLEQLCHVHQLELDKASTEADRRVLECINKTREEYTLKLDSLAQKNDRNQEKNDAIVARNQELTERIHMLELQNKAQ